CPFFSFSSASCFMFLPPPSSPLFPYTTLFRSNRPVRGLVPVVVQAAQIGLQHGRIALDVGRDAFGQHRAEVHDQQVIGEIHHEIHVVLDQQHAHAFSPQLVQHLRQRLLFLLAQATLRVVVL